MGCQFLLDFPYCNGTFSLQKYKAEMPSYFKPEEKKEEKGDKKEEKATKNWDFKEALVFHRFDSFLERLKTIQEFCNTANQFLKLEKVQIDFFSV